MNSSNNLTHCEQNGMCWREDAILLIFTIWDVLDKLLVFAANGGTIMIIYIHRYDMLEIPSNIFIGCLTLGDLVSVVATPFSIASTYLSHTWSWTVNCFLTIWVSTATSLVNTITLCVIAVDRLIYIVYPLQYHNKMPVNRAFIISISIWVFCSLYSLVGVGLGYKDAYNIGRIARPCHSSFSIQGLSRQLLFYPYLIFVPVTIGSYIKVGIVALKQRNRIAAARSNQAQPIGIDFKITKVMLNVISVYIVCTLVVILTPLILKYMNLQDDTREIVFRITVFVWRINTWLNPMIYAWKSQKFRRYVCSIFNKNRVHTNITYIMQFGGLT